MALRWPFARRDAAAAVAVASVCPPLDSLPLQSTVCAGDATAQCQSMRNAPQQCAVGGAAVCCLSVAVSGETRPAGRQSIGIFE